MNALDFFRKIYTLGNNRNSSVKARIEELYSKYQKCHAGAIEEARLRGELLKAQEALDTLRTKVADEIKIFKELTEFFFPQLPQESDKDYQNRLAKKEAIGDYEKVQNRLKYAGKFKGLSEAQQTVLFNEIENKSKIFKVVEPFVNSTAERQLSEAENLLLKAQNEFDDFKSGELPKCHDPHTQELFEYIIHLEELEAEQNG